MEENKRILDLTNLNLKDEEFEAIKRGLDSAVSNTNIRRYFGYADKRELKKICKWCGYFDNKAYYLGAAAATVGWVGGQVLCIYLDRRKKKKILLAKMEGSK